MRTKLQKWGNSLAIRIPKLLARAAALDQNMEVDLELEEGRLVLKPVSDHVYSLEELLKGVSPENLHGEAETGPSRGREEW